MKFGKNLEAGIEQKWKMWRSYALRYNAMKRLLPDTNVESDMQDFHDDREKNNASNGNDGNDGNGGGGGGSSNRCETFWQMYDESVESIQAFYTERLCDSTVKLKELQRRFEKLRSKIQSNRRQDLKNISKNNDANADDANDANHAHNADDIDVDTIESLLESFNQFQEETNLILEFLEINRTACRKILKKYDKRTLSSFKEEKMSQLLETHGFLFGGGLMAGIKFKSDTILHKLKEMDNDSKWSSYNNVPGALEGVEQSKQPKANNIPKYPRLSEEYMKEAQYVLQEVEKSHLFSSNHVRQNAIFSRQEIEIGAFLGAGEYGEVHEIKAFHVKDTCPICFLYQGAQEQSSSSASGGAGEVTSEAKSEKRRFSFLKRRSSSISSIHDNHNNTHHRNANNNQKSIEEMITFAKYGDNNNDLLELEDDHAEEAEELICSRGFMNEHCIRNGIARYALKEVKPTLKGRSLLNGAIDICIEAKFLSVLSHPNVIRLCGTSQVRSCDPHSFLILDRLYGTLGDKIDTWGKSVKNLQKGFFGATRHKDELDYLWNQRLLAMFDIARAMKYLHSNQIIYRDLKPENAGFDIYDNVKLFDFGLAKELQPKHRIGEDLYRASGRTGTRRYMSPENALCKPYGKSSDVYSFGVLLWECLTLKQPFEGMGIEQHAKLVVLGGKRPQIPKSWPIFIKLLTCDSWSANRLDRPGFDEICSVLKGELTEREMNLSNRTNDLMNVSITNRELHNPP